MPLDLYNRETVDRLSTMPGVEVPEPSIWDGFVRGSAQYTMRGFATTARAVDLAGSVGPIIQDAFTDGTEAQDRYFKEHDEVFGSAVDYWTPKPGEVGAAGQVVGTLASMLPTVLTAPELAVLSAHLGTGEELVKRGVPAGKAQVMGALEGGAMGLGIWMPILGQNLWQRALLGGAGYNMAQGLAVRGAGQIILKDTATDKDYQALDLQAITLDALLGLAFGSFAHISPAQRAQGEAAWAKIRDWTQGWKPSDVDALAALRQAEHLNVDSFPGKPAGPEDVIAHVERMRTAIEQLARNEPVDVRDHPAPDTVPATPEEMAAMKKRFAELDAEAEKVMVEEGFPHPDEAPAQPEPIAGPREPVEITPRMNIRDRLQEIVAEREVATPEKQAELDAEAQTLKDQLEPGTETAEENAPERGRTTQEAAAPEDPLAAAAERFAAENPDMLVTVGQNADGTPITQTAKQFLQEARDATDRAMEDSKLFTAAADCLLGRS